MRTIFMGTPDFARSVAEALEERGFDLVAVVTQPDKVSGRGMALKAPPVKVWAQERGIPVYQPFRVREESFVEQMRQLEPGLIVTAAFGQIIPQSILDIPAYGSINIHASLLPKYRGASPIQQALFDGERETGITVMYMSAGMDEGDMILQRTIPIERQDNAGTLFEKLAEEAKLAVGDYADLLQRRKPEGIPQEHTKATYCKKIEKEQGNINWQMDAERIENIVRAMTPSPGAYTFYRNKRIKLIRVEAQSASAAAQPGSIAVVERDAITIACGSGSLRVSVLQPEGKTVQSAEAFINGYRPEKGEQMESEKK